MEGQPWKGRVVLRGQQEILSLPPADLSLWEADTSPKSGPFPGSEGGFLGWVQSLQAVQSLTSSRLPRPFHLLPGHWQRWCRVPVGARETRFSLGECSQVFLSFTIDIRSGLCRQRAFDNPRPLQGVDQSRGHNSLLQELLQNPERAGLIYCYFILLSFACATFASLLPG